MLTIIFVVTATQTIIQKSSMNIDTTTTQYITKTEDSTTTSTSRASTTSTSSTSFITSSSAVSTLAPQSSNSTKSLASASSLPVNLGVESSLSSSKLGLAIGIPMAVLSVCILMVLAWSFAHKKFKRKPRDLLEYQDFPRKRTVDPMLSWQAGKIQEPERNVLERKGVETEKEGESKGVLNRLSRMINISEWPRSLREFKSPLFLRRFHLQNAQENKCEKDLPGLPDVVSTKLEYVGSLKYSLGTEASDYVGKHFVVVKPYYSRLGDELTICTGEKALIKKVHSDGWATVEVGDSKGVVPMMCLKRML